MVQGNEIALINTLQPNEPQIVVHFDQIYPICFVNGPKLVSKKASVLSSSYEVIENSSKTKIQMLVEYAKEVHLATLRFYPYEEENWLKDGKLLFVAGKVQIPKGHLDANIISTQLITHYVKHKSSYRTKCALIIQYSDNIWCCYMDDFCYDERGKDDFK